MLVFWWEGSSNNQNNVYKKGTNANIICLQGLPTLTLNGSTDLLEGDELHITCQPGSTLAANFTYQWYFKQENKATEQQLDGEESSELRRSSVGYQEAGVYRCEVSDGNVAADVSTEVRISCEYMIITYSKLILFHIVCLL